MRHFVKKLTGSVLVVALALLQAACEQMPKVDYDSELEFKPSYSYAWVPQKEIKQHPVISELTMQRVRTASDAKLKQKDWQLVDKEQAEMLLHTFIVVETKVESTGFQANYGMYYRYPHAYTGINTVDVRSYEVGTLIIDMVDPETDKLVWRGHYQSRISSSGRSPEEREEKIRITVDKILDAFPPESNK